ncbi:MAG: peptidylprolyl isomerase [Rudaea sp.]|nr:peptidylprolyl isomerase [Rudaea sp.]
MLACVGIAGHAQTAPAARAQTMAEVLAASRPSDWHVLDPAYTLYLELASGRVVIELAPAFAPNHVANIEVLTREKYFDGLAFLRSQDNYVVQWGDPNGDDEKKRRSVGTAARTLKAEFSIPTGDKLKFTALPDRDGYAPQTGFSGDFPAARDPKSATAWLTHCYGTVGVGRDNDADSGGGTELYVVIGGARWLDRNITVAGRVVKGMELLSTLPRGTGALGFYENAEQDVPIESIRVAADVPVAERTNLEVLRTDTPTFMALIESRRNRHDDWYKVPAGYIDVCSVPIPVRTVGATKP